MKAFNVLELPVSDVHTLHVEEYGNPEGVPVVCLHGGPGAGCSYNEHKLFDLNHFRVILFDQRGAGLSTPYASTEGQSTADLVADMETIRTHLGIETWSVVGGSWGSALALYYANAHPERVEKMLLRGLFMADHKGALNISEDGGANKKRPDYWPVYAAWDKAVPSGKGGLIEAYKKALNCGDREIECEAATRFMAWDNSLAMPEYEDDVINDAYDDPEGQLAISRLWFHYAAEEFIKRSAPEILDMHASLDAVPIDVVQGEKDWICPVENARLFKAEYPHVKTHIIQDGGHSLLDTKITRAVKQVTQRWRDELLQQAHDPAMEP